MKTKPPAAPEPLRRAAETLTAYARVSGGRGMQSLFYDLMHYCRGRRWDFDAELQAAERQFKSEGPPQ